jgi:choice-of-anchor B domain-containing protein
MKKNILWFLLIFSFGRIIAQPTYASLNINLLSHIDPEKTPNPSADNRKYSGCWGWYQSSKNKEYAIVGSNSKTYFIDISNPLSPQLKDSVMGRSGPCTWRELTTYQNYCYVVSDVCTPNSFQIIDMQYLPDSVHVVYDDSTYFERAHTVRVYDNKLYIGGHAKRGGTSLGMNIYSLANPTVPVLLRKISDDVPSITYVHDMFARRDTIFASAGWQGLQVLKFNPGPNNLTVLGSLTSYTESGYNHSSSLTPDGKTLVFCDETPNTSIKIADVTNLANITLSSLMRPNMNVNFVAHNPYVVSNQWVYVSCYQDGLFIYDITNPATPVVKGYFDTYPQGGSGPVTDYGSSQYRGNWGIYPYFPSGVVLACDMQNGIFLLKPSSVIGIKEENKNALTANVYPNPSHGELNIAFANNGVKSYQLEVTTSLGQLVLKDELPNDAGFPVSFKTLDVSRLANGAYFITIKNGERFYQQKFIISK